MFVGIDIGGTFTDVVAVNNNTICYQHKLPTTNNILECVLKALDALLERIGKDEISRLCISTTIITNTIVKNNLPPTTLIIMPGPGLNCEHSFPVKPTVISGYTNHLGNTTAAAGVSELSDCIHANNIAISGKFSVRNPENEQAVLSYLKANSPNANIVAAHMLSGKLNFIRRTNTAYYAAATQEIFAKFKKQVKQAVLERNLNIPITILKADAGAVNLDQDMINTAEFVFTGPSASVLGIKALIQPQDDCIALDIGGTTTDISFWHRGQPLLNHKGAKISNFDTSINTFYMQSLALGGNSIVYHQANKISIGPEISADCICLGGDHLTLTDIFSLLGVANIGDSKYVRNYLENYGLVTNFAEQVFELALNTIKQKLFDMIEEINRTPVYTVADLFAPDIFTPNRIIGVGDAATAIVPHLSKSMNLKYYIPEFAPVANALGASLAKPTMIASIQVNTLAGYYTLSQDSNRYHAPRNLNKHMTKEILLKNIQNLASSAKVSLPESDIEVSEYEEYTVLSGYSDNDLVINMTMQVKPDILVKILDGGACK